LSRDSPRVGDSGEGRWVVQSAVELGVPVPVMAAALFSRFDSRGESDFADRMLSAMRRAFGGHGGAPTPPES
jgi:6-phosphogluconate dehydrogenase